MEEHERKQFVEDAEDVKLGEPKRKQRTPISVMCYWQYRPYLYAWQATAQEHQVSYTVDGSACTPTQGAHGAASDRALVKREEAACTELDVPSKRALPISPACLLTMPVRKAEMLMAARARGKPPCGRSSMSRAESVCCWQRCSMLCRPSNPCPRKSCNAYRHTG